MYRNFTNKRKFQDANSIGADGTVQNIPIADANLPDNYMEQLESTLPQDNLDLKFEDLSFSAQQDPYMRKYYGITEGTTYNPPSGMQPAGPPQASTPDMKPVTLGQRMRDNKINRLQKRLSNIEEGRESKIAKAVDLLGLGNIGTAGGYMQAFTDLPERAFARAGYNMAQGPRGKARALGNIIEASTGLGGAFLQGLGSFKKTKPMTEEEYIAAKQAEQAKKNNTVRVGDKLYNLVEDEEGRMSIGSEYEESETMQMGGVMRLQNANPTAFNPFAIQTPSIQPFTMEQVDADFANVPEPSPFMTDFDMDGIPDYIDIDAGEGTNQALPGVLGGPSIATPTPTDFSYPDASSPVDMTTDSDGDGIPDYQDDFDNSIVSEEERQKDIAKQQNSLFGMAASLGSAVGSDDLTSRAARAGLMAGRLLQGESPLASTIGLGAGLGSVGFGAARTMKGARAEAIATADARKRAAERLRQGIMTGGTKGRDVASLESYLQSSTYDPMATEFGQDGMMMGGNNGGMAQGGNQGTPPPKGVVIGRNTAKYFQKPQLPVSPNGLVEYPNQMVNVPTTGTITMNEEKAGGPLPKYVLAVPNGDTPVIMQNGYDYEFPNSDMVTEIPLNKALYV
tara:strand:+ start:18594 stop:20459 length:1866 start_codon:yes stop_codon:yes gene_type:complete